MARVVITGGAGFIGCNLAERLLSADHDVTILDDLSRASARGNVEHLRDRHGEVRFLEADVRDAAALVSALEGAQRVYHLAGQVAVTTSLLDPRRDFEANALGTFNVLEAARLAGDDPIVLYASTNKVYGALDDVVLVEGDTRYDAAALPLGVSETTPLDFHSPYGCSKGAGDQYARDYHRIYGVRTVVLRQSCIVGRHQLGVEDQGWAAWLILAALTGRPITIFGDGKQVRDVLDVDDLLDAYEAAVDGIATAAGQVYNVGGGPRSTIAVWREFGPLLEQLVGHAVPVTMAPARAGDQRWYVSDIGKAQRDLGWTPKVGAEEAITSLHAWIVEHLHALEPPG